jgi:hypothetical protein
MKKAPEIITISGAFFWPLASGYWPLAWIVRRYIRAVAFRHFMQSLIFFIVPLTRMFLTRRLGKKMRGFTLCE